MFRLIKFTALYAITWAFVLWLIFPGHAEGSGRASVSRVTAIRPGFSVTRSFGFGHHAGGFLPSRGLFYRSFGYGRAAAPLLLYTQPAAVYVTPPAVTYVQPAPTPATAEPCPCTAPAAPGYVPPPAMAPAPVAYAPAPAVAYAPGYTLPARELTYLRTLSAAERVRFLEFRHGRVVGQRLFFNHFGRGNLVGRGRTVEVIRTREAGRGLLPGRQRTVTRQVIRTR